MHKVKIGVLVSGGGTNLQVLIDEIEKGTINGEIVVVVSDRKDAYALNRAKSHNIPAVLVDKKDYETNCELNEIIMEVLESFEVEFVVLAGFLSILTSKFVGAFEKRIINVHPSLIPSFCGSGYYGIRVHEKAIEYGVKLSGATVHFVDEGTDTGAIILQEAVSVCDDETAKTLHEKVLMIEHRLLPEAIRLFCDRRLIIEGRKVRIKKGE